MAVVGSVISLRFVISLSFIQLSTPETNLALNKNASASYEILKHPSVLIDGSASTNWGSGSCFNCQSTDAAGECWWQVDLQKVYLVSKVKVTNRGDCCPQRLRDFSLDVYEANPTLYPSTPVKNCYFHAGPVAGGVTLTLLCHQPVEGRYLRITKWANQLQLCEVQVFALESDTCQFTLHKERRCNASALLQSHEVINRMECAERCLRYVNCTGFNIQYQPEVACELLRDPNVTDFVEDPSADCYTRDSCYNRCGEYI